MVALITHVSAVSTSAIPTLPSSRSPLSSVTLVSKSEHACRIRRTQKHTSCELNHASRHSGAPHRIEARRDEKAVTTGWRLGATPSGAETSEEVVFFDGGPHWGDLVVNLAFGLTGVWIPLTLAAVFRSLNLRYRFTDKRVTIMSLSDGDRQDFPYSAITDVKYAGRFVGEWGDIAITLSDKTIVEIKSVPKFREISKYCLQRVEKVPTDGDDDLSDTGIVSKKGRGFGTS